MTDNTALAQELEPCPFCGGEAEIDLHQGFRHYRTGQPLDQVSIYCTTCSANISYYPGDLDCDRDGTAELCIAEWNTRTPAPAPVGGDVVAWILQVGEYRELSHKRPDDDPNWRPLYAHPQHPARASDENLSDWIAEARVHASDMPPVIQRDYLNAALDKLERLASQPQTPTPAPIYGHDHNCRDGDCDGCKVIAYQERAIAAMQGGDALSPEAQERGKVAFLLDVAAAIERDARISDLTYAEIESLVHAVIAAAIRGGE